jgi:hypothetical protein
MKNMAAFAISAIHNTLRKPGLFAADLAASSEGQWLQPGMKFP